MGFYLSAVCYHLGQIVLNPSGAVGVKHSFKHSFMGIRPVASTLGSRTNMGGGGIEDNVELFPTEKRLEKVIGPLVYIFLGGGGYREVCQLTHHP